MVSVASIDEEPVFVEVEVGHKVRVATELAAIAGAKPVSDLLEDILVDYLSKSGYLADPIDFKKVLAAN
jgi:hypothetical protein